MNRWEAAAQLRVHILQHVHVVMWVVLLVLYRASRRLRDTALGRCCKCDLAAKAVMEVYELHT